METCHGVEVLVAERIDWFDPLVRPSYDGLTLTDKGIGAIAKMCPILSAKTEKAPKRVLFLFWLR